MAKVISISNQKGGVGKTTTAVNLSASIGMKGKMTLIIDADPQGNTTAGLGVDKRSVNLSTYDILTGDLAADEAILHTDFKNLDIIPAHMDLAAVDLELATVENKEIKLREKLLPILDRYDYVFIDCPPSLGMITANAICASNSILIPMQCEYYALEGLSQLMNTMKLLKKFNKGLEIEGILMTMYDSRLKITEQVITEVKRHFPQKVFKTFIRRGVRLSEAPSFGMPVYYYDKSCRGAQEYIDLAHEILKNNK